MLRAGAGIIVDAGRHDDVGFRKRGRRPDLQGIAEDLGAPSPVPPAVAALRPSDQRYLPSADPGLMSSTHYGRAQRWHGALTTTPAHRTVGLRTGIAAAGIQPLTGKRPSVYEPRQ